MNPALAVATAVTFVWLGMVLATSFLQTRSDHPSVVPGDVPDLTNASAVAGVPAG